MYYACDALPFLPSGSQIPFVEQRKKTTRWWTKAVSAQHQHDSIATVRVSVIAINICIVRMQMLAFSSKNSCSHFQPHSTCSYMPVYNMLMCLWETALIKLHACIVKWLKFILISFGIFVLFCVRHTSCRCRCILWILNWKGFRFFTCSGWEQRIHMKMQTDRDSSCRASSGPQGCHELYSGISALYSNVMNVQYIYFT